MSKELVIKRTATITTKVPFNEEYYPDHATVGEAVEYEQGQDGEEHWTAMVEAVISSEDMGNTTFEVSIEVHDTETGEKQVHPTKSVAP